MRLKAERRARIAQTNTLKVLDEERGILQLIAKRGLTQRCAQPIDRRDGTFDAELSMFSPVAG